ncbi:MAG: diacylglycerol kinase family protein [Candidatus Brocadiia bacterium]
MRSVLLLVNPYSGRGRGKRLAPHLAELISSLGFEVDLYLAEQPGTIEQRSAEAKEGQIIAVMGGDGTVNAVVHGLNSRKVPILVLPFGTANVVAKELNLSRDPLKAALTLKSYSIVDWDIAWCGDKPVVFSLSAGFDAYVVHRMAESRNGGHCSFVSYIAPSMKTMFGFRPHPIEISVDGEPLSEKSYYFLAINCKRYAGDFLVAPQASTCDGRFDLMTLASSSLCDHIRYITVALSGKMSKMRDVRLGTFVNLRAESPGKVPVQIDGEAAGFLPVTIETRPSSCCFLVPRSCEAADDAAAC